MNHLLEVNTEYAYSPTEPAFKEALRNIFFFVAIIYWSHIIKNGPPLQSKKIAYFVSIKNA